MMRFRVNQFRFTGFLIIAPPEPGQWRWFLIRCYLMNPLAETHPLKADQRTTLTP